MALNLKISLLSVGYVNLFHQTFLCFSNDPKGGLLYKANCDKVYYEECDACEQQHNKQNILKWNSHFALYTFCH